MMFDIFLFLTSAVISVKWSGQSYLANEDLPSRVTAPEATALFDVGRRKTMNTAIRKRGGALELSNAGSLFSRMSLLLSLWLFSASVLEAAPKSWSLMANYPHLLVAFYKVMLGGQCFLLLLVFPTILAITLVTMISPDLTILSPCESAPLPSGESTSPISARGNNNISNQTTSPRSQSTPTNEDIKKRKRPHLLCFSILSFCFLGLRYFFQFFFGMLLPTNIYDVNSNRSKHCADSRNHRYMHRQTWRKTPCITFLLLLLAVTFSFFVMLKSTRSIVINTSRNYGVEHHQIDQNECTLLQYCVMTICSFGILVSAVINGFGSVSLPHSNLVGIHTKGISKESLSKMEEDFLYALRLLEKKRLMLAESKCHSPKIATKTFRLCDYWNKVTRAPSSLKEKNTKQLEYEVNFLENLVGEMSDDIEEMKHSQRLAIDPRSILGLFRGTLGMIFSVVLLFRVAVAALSFASLKDPSSRKLNPSNDPISKALLWLIGHNFVSQEHYQPCLQGTSLLLAGILSISQIRNILRLVRAVSRKINQFLGVSCMLSFSLREGRVHSKIVSLLSSFVMGCYLTSCVVVMKMNLPVDYKSSFSEALGNFNLEINGNILDLFFCASASVSAFVLGIIFGIRRDSTKRHQLELQFNSSESAFPGVLSHIP